MSVINTPVLSSWLFQALLSEKRHLSGGWSWGWAALLLTALAGPVSPPCEQGHPHLRTCSCLEPRHLCRERGRSRAHQAFFLPVL